MKFTLTVVGLGPGGEDFLTAEALKVLKSASVVYVRTLRHPLIELLKDQGVIFESYDWVYEDKPTFESVYEAVAQDVAQKAKNENVVYAVPGNPFVAEKTVTHLCKWEKTAPWEMRIVHGVSFIDAMLTTLRRDPINGLKILNALDMEKHIPDPQIDNIVIQMYDRMTASNVKMALLKVYEDNQPVFVIRGAGVPEIEEIRALSLYEIDTEKGLYDHLTSLLIPKVEEEEKTRYGFQDLIWIMERLRSEDGCPWDRKQTHDSLKPHLVEEAYEVVNAIEKNDVYELEEELGDVLLQVVFHSQIAAQNGFFHMGDVTTAICKKLIRRHPHVFGDLKVNDAQTVFNNWEAIKKGEKKENLHVESMERIPQGMPTLMRAYKIQKKAAAQGFDWENIDGAIEKVKEEFDEFLQSFHMGKKEDTIDELGDLLFSVVNVCRFLEIRPEMALNRTNEKFIKRFRHMEEKISKKGAKMENYSIEELDILWESAKKEDL